MPYLRLSTRLKEDLIVFAWKNFDLFLNTMRPSKNELFELQDKGQEIEARLLYEEETKRRDTLISRKAQGDIP